MSMFTVENLPWLIVGVLLLIILLPWSVIARWLLWTIRIVGVAIFGIGFVVSFVVDGTAFADRFEPGLGGRIWETISSVPVSLKRQVCAYRPDNPQLAIFCDNYRPPVPPPLTPPETKVVRAPQMTGDTQTDVSSEQPEGSDRADAEPRSTTSTREESQPAAVPRVEVIAGLPGNRRVLQMKPGLGRIESFRDCTDCPEMVVIPSGTFRAGAANGRVVSIMEPFAIGKHEVTVAQWRACVEARWCRKRQQPGGTSASAGFPVVNVSYIDARDYAVWLSQKTGKSYKLPTAGEWEYAARSTSTGRYWWQRDEINALYANYRGSEGKGSIGALEPVDSYPPNIWGLYNVHGNVAEWVHDCADSGCSQRAVRGGSRKDYAQSVTTTAQIYLSETSKNKNTGFRIMRDLATGQ